MMNYTVNVYENGNTTSIVTDSGIVVCLLFAIPVILTIADLRSYCRFQLAFENKVPKFVTNVRNYISKVRN